MWRCFVSAQWRLEMPITQSKVVDVGQYLLDAFVYVVLMIWNHLNIEVCIITFSSANTQLRNEDFICAMFIIFLLGKPITTKCTPT